MRAHQQKPHGLAGGRPSTSRTVKKLPSDLLIFSPFTSSMPLCTQTLAKPAAGEGAAGLRDLVLMMREDQVIAAAMNVEILAEMRQDIAEHSICQPGRPRPQGLTPSPADLRVDGFHSTKSPGIALIGRDIHPRAGDQVLRRAAGELP
jgi:hypothetical protein